MGLGGRLLLREEQATDPQPIADGRVVALRADRVEALDDFGRRLLARVVLADPVDHPDQAPLVVGGERPGLAGEVADHCEDVREARGRGSFR